MGRLEDTSLGGRSPAFPSTLWPALERLRKKEPDADREIAQLVSRYWKPVYACVRLGWNRTNEDAKDLTQEFFIFLLEGDALASADPSRGRFRTYLKTVLRNFLTGEHRRATRVKRGGGARVQSLDLKPEDFELPPSATTDPEQIFDREWARTLVSEALAEVSAWLVAAGKGDHWRILESHDLGEGEGPSYGEIAARFGLSEGQVKNILTETRKRVREAVLVKIRDYALDEGEVWEELGYLMGLWKA